MNLRSLSVASLAGLSLMLCGCPRPEPIPDANGTGNDFDAGNPNPRDACSGGCASNQVCDTARRTCVDACGGCDAGTCVQISQGVFQCRTQAVSCSGNLCEPGQVACLGGECACLSSISGALDTCKGAGKWCNGRVCSNPRALQQCTPGDTNSPCPSGFLCQPVFGDRLAVCTKMCMDNAQCQRGEFCSSVGCLASGLFRDQECNQTKLAADGGIVRTDAGSPLRITVPVSHTCLLKNSDGNIVDPAPEGKGSGNCTYTIFQFWNDGFYPTETCRPPGNATEGQPCRDDYSMGTIATQCSTGLQCTKTKGGDEGVCLRMCNAQPASLGYPLEPACNADEACVNTLRYTDPNSNAVLGVCMKKCNAFDAMKNTCANVGSNAASCVPTEASGELLVSTNGDGICVPQRPRIASIAQQCDEVDAFRGAACGSAQLCTSLDADTKATCTAICDLECNPLDGGIPPGRCATEPNARCTVGTCRRVTSTSGARVGFCL